MWKLKGKGEKQRMPEAVCWVIQTCLWLGQLFLTTQLHDLDFTLSLMLSSWCTLCLQSCMYLMLWESESTLNETIDDTYSKVISIKTWIWFKFRCIYLSLKVLQIEYFVCLKKCPMLLNNQPCALIKLIKDRLSRWNWDLELFTTVCLFKTSNLFMFAW